MGSSAPAELEPELPRRVGRYDAFLPIGVGGMARVYLGVQHGPFSTKRLVVLKQLRREISNDPQFLEMFIDEARIALRLNHPNVVHTYEVLDETPDLYLVMEYLEGQSLLEIFRGIGREKVPLQEHVWILTQLLAGLHYAHELRDFNRRPLQIVHRDVSPANVFVCKTGCVKLLDFGIAKLAGAVAATRNGILKGKLGYVAPEQCLGLAASVQSDIYSVGVMLWEAMARRRRNSGETEAAQIQARIQGSEPPIDRVWPQAPPALTAITRRALSTHPEERYASAREFQTDLERFLAHKQSRASAESVSRLVQAHFEKDWAVRHSSIAAKLEESNAAMPLKAARPAGTASLSLPSANHKVDLTALHANSEANTSLVTIDALLLQATRPDSAIALARRNFIAALQHSAAQLATRFVRGFRGGVVSFRRSRRGALPMIAALATAVVVVAFSDTRHEVTKLVRSAANAAFAVPRHEVVEPGRAAANAPVVLAQQQDVPAPVAPQIDDPPEKSPADDVDRAFEVTTPSEASSANPPVQLMSSPAVPVAFKDTSATREHKSRDRRARSPVGSGLRTQTMQRPAAESRATLLEFEPGMDLRTKSVERVAGCIDEQDPYP